MLIAGKQRARMVDGGRIFGGTGHFGVGVFLAGFFAVWDDFAVFDAWGRVAVGSRIGGDGVAGLPGPLGEQAAGFFECGGVFP